MAHLKEKDRHEALLHLWARFCHARTPIEFQVRKDHIFTDFSDFPVFVPLSQ